MENIEGDLLLCNLTNGTLVNLTSDEFPKLSNISIDGSSLKISPGQKVDFGVHNDRCMGNIELCTDGITVEFWIKVISPGLHIVISIHILDIFTKCIKGTTQPDGLCVIYFITPFIKTC